MKTGKISKLICICTFFLYMTGNALLAQQANNKHHTISGVIKDAQSKKKLENASITVFGTDIATVSNSDGEFTIKIPEAVQYESLAFSLIGYTNQKVTIKNETATHLTIWMTPNSKVLKEVVVEGIDALDLVKLSIEKIRNNYSKKDNLLTAFYRETVKKKSNYINISEAIINVYKTPYAHGIEADNIAIYKGRKLLSQKSSDTLAVKLLGGPNMAVMMDIVKNKDVLFDSDLLHLYKFKMEEPVMIDNRFHYVVGFWPNAIASFPLFEGYCYIDKQSLAFSRIEMKVSMNDIKGVTQMILSKKPPKLRFKPEEVSFLITYKQHEGATYLNYIQNRIRFKCDWNRKLFSTNYTISSELVTTGIKEQDVTKISGKERFKANQSLTDKVSNFTNPNFWEDYNIIEPTESLESAVYKLKKQYK